MKVRSTSIDVCNCANAGLAEREEIIERQRGELQHLREALQIVCQSHILDTAKRVASCALGASPAPVESECTYIFGEPVLRCADYPACPCGQNDVKYAFVDPPAHLAAVIAEAVEQQKTGEQS